jgi:hypothetical protein
VSGMRIHGAAAPPRGPSPSGQPSAVDLLSHPALGQEGHLILGQSFSPSSPHSGNGQLQGGSVICSREWLAAPPLVLLPRQEVTELLKKISQLDFHSWRQVGSCCDSVCCLANGGGEGKGCFVRAYPTFRTALSMALSRYTHRPFITFITAHLTHVHRLLQLLLQCTDSGGQGDRTA